MIELIYESHNIWRGSCIVISVVLILLGLVSAKEIRESTFIMLIVPIVGLCAIQVIKVKYEGTWDLNVMVPLVIAVCVYVIFYIKWKKRVSERKNTD